MSQVREPAVAGFFYPAGSELLRSTVTGMLEVVPVRSGPQPKALVVPHAGYAFSGPVAASAYARLLPCRGRYHRVVLLGPAHRLPVCGLASSSATGFRTPLGVVAVDREAIALANLRENDDGHRLEHSLEVQLPFLQVVLEDFLLVPLVVGDAAPENVAAVIDALWDGPDTLICISTDLSHYLSYEQARSHDRATCSAIERMDAASIGLADACGATALAGLLITARQRGLSIERLDLRNSGDTAGDRRRVVGYGAWLLWEQSR